MRLLLPTIALLLVAPPAQAQTDGWVAQKCAIFADAWNDALDDLGSDQLNYAFIAGGENFILGGCTERIDLCPRSDQELDIANRLSLAMINSGTASTFLPFRCPHPEGETGGWTGPGL